MILIPGEVFLAKPWYIIKQHHHHHHTMSREEESEDTEAMPSTFGSPGPSSSRTDFHVRTPTPLEQVGGHEPVALIMDYMHKEEAVILVNSTAIQTILAVKSQGKVTPGTRQKGKNTEALSLFSYSYKLDALVLTRLVCAEHKTTLELNLTKMAQKLRRFNMVITWKKPDLDRFQVAISDVHWDKSEGKTTNTQSVMWADFPNQHSKYSMLRNLGKLDPKITHEFVIVQSPGTANDGTAETKGDIVPTADI